MKPMRHITVVYTIADDDLFRKELTKIMDQFSDIQEKPWSVTAVSMEHEIRRLELIEEALELQNLSLATSILSRADIGNVESLDELLI